MKPGILGAATVASLMLFPVAARGADGPVAASPSATHLPSTEQVPATQSNPAKPVPSTSVAVFDLEPKSGIDPAVVELISETLIAEVRNRERVQVIGAREIDAMLGFESKKQVLGCEAGSCIADIGGALGVDKMVIGNVGRIGKSFVFTVKLVDVKASQVEKSVNKRLQGGDEEKVLDLIAPSVEELFSGYPQHRKIASVSPSGAATSENSVKVQPGTGEVSASTTASATIEAAPSAGGGGIGLLTMLGGVASGLGVLAAGAGGVFLFMLLGDIEAYNSASVVEDRARLREDMTWKSFAFPVGLGAGGLLAAAGVTMVILDLVGGGEGNGVTSE